MWEESYEWLAPMPDMTFWEKASQRGTKMEKKRKIVQYRERLDKTLSSPDLTDVEILKKHVKSQLLPSSELEDEGVVTFFYLFILVPKCVRCCRYNSWMYRNCRIVPELSSVSNLWTKLNHMVRRHVWEPN